MIAGVKALLNVTSGALTVSVADAGSEFVAPCVLDTEFAGTVFTCEPGSTPSTVTETVQLAAAPTLPLTSAKVVAPAVAVTVPARTSWTRSARRDLHAAGSASLTARFVSATRGRRVPIVSVKRTFADTTDEGAKAFASVTGGAAVTISVASAECVRRTLQRRQFAGRNHVHVGPGRGAEPSATRCRSTAATLPSASE